MSEKKESSIALGITAMIFAIIAIGPYLTIISGFIAIFSFGKGYVFGLVSILLNILTITKNLIFFSYFSKDGS